MTALDIRCEIW